jgi:hypothetical protein
MLMYSQDHKKWEPCGYFDRKFVVVVCYRYMCASPDKLWGSWLVELHAAFFYVFAADMNRNFSVIEFGG